MDRHGGAWRGAAGHGEARQGKGRFFKEQTVTFRDQVERAAAAAFAEAYELKHRMPWPHGDKQDEWPVRLRWQFQAEFFPIFIAGMIWGCQHVGELRKAGAE